MRKTFIAPFIGLFMLVSTALAVGPTTQSVSAATPGCNENSIIKCGAHSPTELRAKYKENATGDLDNVYSHYGISASMINGSMKTGTLTRDGNVVVDGKVVATGAETVGRHYLSGSKTVKINNETYYQRSTTISLPRDSEVFVWFDANGQYLGSLIQYCGNPVKATPKPQPKPAAECVDLDALRISRNVYVFSGKASTSDGATVSAHKFTITAEDGTSQIVTVTTTSTSAKTGEVNLKDGTTTAKLTVTTSVGAKESAACVVKVNVQPLPPEQTEVCNPANGQVISVDKDKVDQYKPVGDEACQPKVQGATVEELPSTGPAEMLGGGLGLTSLSAAAYYWRASRKEFVSKLLNR